MTDRMRWIEHKGKKILFVDCSQLSGEEALAVHQRFVDFVTENDLHDLLTLLDVTESIISKDLLSKLREGARLQSHRYKKAALVGVAGRQRFFFQIVRQFTKHAASLHETPEEAMDALVED